jgi:hypothetical protein
MPRVRLPDGSIRDFPDQMSKAEIAAVVRREFPPPRPTTLEAGERARRANGAEVSFSQVMQRYLVHDAAGTPRGFRTSLDAAIDLADALPALIPPCPVKAPTTAPTVRDVAAPELQIAADIERHIRQSEGQARRPRRFEIVEHRRGRRKAV